MNKNFLRNTLVVVALSTGHLFAAATQKAEKLNCPFSSCKCLLPENPIENNQCPAAYNLSASIQVCNEWKGQNSLFFDASYTYWYAAEDGLDLARSGDFLMGDDPFFNPTNTLFSQPFHYQSGFKVGAGWRTNDWVLSGQYTWIRNSTSKNSSAPTINPDLGTGVWVTAPWFLQLAQDGGSLFGTQVLSKWDLRMSIADLALSRPYYLGRHLTVTPFGGLRAAWIHQKLNIRLTEVPNLVIPSPSQPIHSSNWSNSWSIGPRFGAEAHVLLGCGFRIQGDLALSLLFTKYTKISHQEDAAATAALPENTSASLHNKTALRPVLESGLGLGWGSYLCSNKYHIDFSADYDFMLWWNQNMMRKMMSSFWNGTPVNGDLFLHGLTLSTRFSF